MLRDKVLCPKTSLDKITFPKEDKKQEKDVLKQEEDILKQENDMSKQERIFLNRKGHSKTGKDILKQERTF